MKQTFDRILKEAARRGASDVHFTVGIPAQLRVEGEWSAFDDHCLDREHCDELVAALLSPQKLERFQARMEIDLSYSIAGVGRFRINLFFQRGSGAVAVRVLPYRLPSFEELGLPAAIMTDLCNVPHGLVLVCGPTGSGKSTTLAAMIAHMNRTRKNHIVTIEDPIEFLHDHEESIVDQREIGTDSLSFHEAMKHVLRQSPDVVLVGEVRDSESVKTALMLAETGHLVLTTIHTGEATQALSRLSDMFPAEQQAEIRVSLSLVLRGMIVQQLLPSCRKDRRRVLAIELLRANAAIRNLIRTGQFQQIYSLLQTQQSTGMRTMNMSLLDLLAKKEIVREVALTKSPKPAELETMIGHHAARRRQA